MAAKVFNTFLASLGRTDQAIAAACCAARLAEKDQSDLAFAQLPAIQARAIAIRKVGIFLKLSAAKTRRCVDQGLSPDDEIDIVQIIAVGDGHGTLRGLMQCLNLSGYLRCTGQSKFQKWRRFHEDSDRVPWPQNPQYC